jgi:hypothetical protein
VEPRCHILGLQASAARQEAVMLDEGFHRLEQRGPQAASWVPPAGVGMRLT